MHRIRLTAILCALFSVYGVVSAQTNNTGAITGTVSDQSSAVLVGAHITLTSVETGAATKTDSNSSGNYRFSFLQPGHYKVAVDRSGFSRLEKEVQVQVGQVSNGDIQLVMGARTRL